MDSLTAQDLDRLESLVKCDPIDAYFAGEKPTTELFAAAPELIRLARLGLQAECCGNVEFTIAEITTEPPSRQ